MWHKVKKLDKPTIKSIFRGEIGQLKIELEAAKRGYGISVPTLSLKYDLILDDNGKLYRVQIKYLNRKSGKNSVELKLVDKRYKYSNGYTKENVDLILVYIPKNESILCLTPDFFTGKKTIAFNLNNKKSPMYYEKFLW